MKNELLTTMAEINYCYYSDLLPIFHLFLTDTEDVNVLLGCTIIRCTCIVMLRCYDKGIVFITGKLKLL